MSPTISARVASLLGWAPTRIRRVEGRGYSPAERWIVADDAGHSAFVKVGATPFTAEALRAEHAFYRRARGEFLLETYGFDDAGPHPVLALEDASRAHWPPPWRPGDLARVTRALASLARRGPEHADLPSLEEQRDALTSWSDVRQNPASFLSLGLCTWRWLERALPSLLSAEDAATLEGDALLHGDVRSDNLCLLPDRVAFIDWTDACRGNPATDLAFAAPSIAAEGGPPPERLVPDAPELAALVAGFFAARAGLPDLPEAPRVRWIQRQQLRHALPWAARALGLPAPDGAAAPEFGAP